MNLTEEQITFLKGYDFMRIGHAISMNNWTNAGMAVFRVQKKCAELNLDDLEKNFKNLKLCIAHKDKRSSQDILAVIVSKRVRLLNSINKR